MLYYQFTEILKTPKTSFQSLEVNKNMLEMFAIQCTLSFDQLSFTISDLKENQKCNFHYEVKVYDDVTDSENKEFHQNTKLWIS